MRIEKPFILIIDDDPDRVRAEATLLLAQRAVAHVVHPKEIELPDLNRADLVLVDYVLDKWEARDAQSVISPQTGDRDGTHGYTA